MIDTLSFSARRPYITMAIGCIGLRGIAGLCEDGLFLVHQLPSQDVSSPAVLDPVPQPSVAHLPSVEAACRARDDFESLAGELRTASGRWPAAAIGEEYVRDYGKIQPSVDTLRTTLDDAAFRMETLCER